MKILHLGLLTMAFKSIATASFSVKGSSAARSSSFPSNVALAATWSNLHLRNVSRLDRSLKENSRFPPINLILRSASSSVRKNSSSLEENRVCHKTDSENHDDDEDLVYDMEDYEIPPGFELSEVEDEITSQTDSSDVDDETLDYSSLRRKVQQIENDVSDIDQQDFDFSKLPKGTPDGFYIERYFHVPPQGFHDILGVCSGISQEEMDRLKISADNCTLPIALMILDPDEYPTLSRARKACR